MVKRSIGTSYTPSPDHGRAGDIFLDDAVPPDKARQMTYNAIGGGHRDGKDPMTVLRKMTMYLLFLTLLQSHR